MAEFMSQLHLFASANLPHSTKGFNAFLIHKMARAIRCVCLLSAASFLSDYGGKMDEVHRASTFLSVSR